MSSTDAAPQGSRVARNTTYLTLAFIGQRILSSLYIPIIAVLVGPTVIGDYFTALAFINLFTIFIDLGLTPAFIRQTARSETEGREDLRAIMAVKLISAVVVTGLMFGVVLLVTHRGLTHTPPRFFYWAAVAMILDSMTMTMYGFFRGIQRLEFESVGTVLHRIIIMIVAITVVQLGGPSIIIIIALVAGSTGNFLYAAFHLWRQGFSFRPHWSWPVIKRLLILAWPFALASLAVAIYANSDNVLLTLFKDRRIVGLYGTASKVILAFQVLPSALVAAIYPAMSAMYQKENEALEEIFTNSMRYLMIVAIPVMVTLALLAHPIILIGWKKVWLDAVWPLRVLALGLPFLFLNFPVGYLLNATNHQTRNTINIAITVVLNIVANIFLIRRYSYHSVAVRQHLSHPPILLSFGRGPLSVIIGSAL
ncbi:MAG: flippase [Candidatus Kerfeldbacteria bacterium]|nr:flippase [Candidatus Kerfeldbacteria bacterium]